MSEPIHLKVCPSCRTAIPEESRTCPECGAPQPPAAVPPGTGAPPEAFDVMEAVLRGQPGSRRAVAGLGAREVLRDRLGCLATALLLLFGVPFLFGLLFGDPLGVLGVLLLAVGAAGLCLTAVLLWVLWPYRRRG